MKKIRYLIFLIPLFAISLNFFFISPASATFVPPDKGPTYGCPADEPNCRRCPPNYSGNCGNYDANSFLLIGIAVAQWILGITGALTLLAFIYGGVLFLISAGNKELVAKAKKVMIGAIVGMAIVFLSYTIIGFVFNSLGIKDAGWDSSNWFDDYSPPEPPTPPATP